jgi:hypothetical protein
VRFWAGEGDLIRCEYLFENFDARGGDDYLNRFARKLDELFRAGWTAPEVNRDPALKGWWQLSLVKYDSSEPRTAPSRS